MIAWLEQQDPVCRGVITHVSMDTSGAYARAARLALPHATVIVDRFHPVQPKNRAITECRREPARARRGRLGRNAMRTVDPTAA